MRKAIKKLIGRFVESCTDCAVANTEATKIMLDDVANLAKYVRALEDKLEAAIDVHGALKATCDRQQKLIAEHRVSQNTEAAIVETQLNNTRDRIEYIEGWIDKVRAH